MTTSTGEPSLADLISYQISPDWLAEQTFTERDASAVASIIDDIAERIAHHRSMDSRRQRTGTRSNMHPRLDAG